MRRSLAIVLALVFGAVATLVYSGWLGGSPALGDEIAVTTAAAGDAGSASLHWFKCQFSESVDTKPSYDGAKFKINEQRKRLDPNDRTDAVYALDPVKGELFAYRERDHQLFRLPHVTTDERWIIIEGQPSVVAGIQTVWYTSISRETGHIADGFRITGVDGITTDHYKDGVCMAIEPMIVDPIPQKF